MSLSSTGLSRAMAAVSIDVSKAARNTNTPRDGKPKKNVPVGTEFGEWVTISESYFAQGDNEKQRCAKVMARCSCGREYEKNLSKLKQMSTKMCIECKYHRQRRQAS